MKKIIVMSDTHFYGDEFKSYDAFQSLDFNSYDHIIHLGDFTSIEFYQYLKSTDKLLAVLGNNDFYLPSNLPLENSIVIEKHKIAFLHGHTINIQNISYFYPNDDIIIFGHLHDPFYKEIIIDEEKIKKQYVLSPGSFTHNRYVDYNSFMTIELEQGKEPKIELVKI